MDQTLTGFVFTAEHWACALSAFIWISGTTALLITLLNRTDARERRSAFFGLLLICAAAYVLRLAVIPPWIYEPSGDEERMIFGPFLGQWQVSALPQSSGLAADVWAWAFGAPLRMMGIAAGPRTLPWINQVATLPALLLLGLACHLMTDRRSMAWICTAAAAISPQLMFWSTSAYDLAPAIPALAAWLLCLTVLLDQRRTRRSAILAAISAAGCCVWLVLCRVELWLPVCALPATLILAALFIREQRARRLAAAALCIVCLALAVLLLSSATEARTGTKVFALDQLLLNFDASRWLNSPFGGLVPLFLSAAGYLGIRKLGPFPVRSALIASSVAGLALWAVCLAYDGFASKYAVWTVLLLAPLWSVAMSWPAQIAQRKVPAVALTLLIVTLVALPPLLRWGSDVRVTADSFHGHVHTSDMLEIPQEVLLKQLEGQLVFASPGLHDPLREAGLLADGMLFEAMQLVGPRRLEPERLLRIGEEGNALRLVAPYDHKLTAIGWYDRLYRERALFNMRPVARGELLGQPVLLYRLELRPGARRALSYSRFKIEI
ncbi:MAG: hypothetical protein P9M14_06765 [Candidatus Alcyoniella australis]|nr:hypothetical protein [Candidatus Alcyoniella australis]